MSSTFPFKVPCCLKRMKRSTPRLQTHTHTDMWANTLAHVTNKSHSQTCTGTLRNASKRHKTTQFVRFFISNCDCVHVFARTCVHAPFLYTWLFVWIIPKWHVAGVHLRLVSKIHTHTHTSLSFISTRPQIYSEPMSRVLPPGFGNDCQSGSP